MVLAQTKCSKHWHIITIMKNVPLFIVTACLGHRLARTWREKHPLSISGVGGTGLDPRSEGTGHSHAFLIAPTTYLPDFMCNGLASELLFKCLFCFAHIRGPL